MNIVGNAIKFSHNGGQVTIRCRELEDGIEVAVKDNGIGMSEETKKRLFEQFYQEQGSRSTQGNGLGLTITKRIVDLMEGEITVVSAENLGSEFIVRLPVIGNIKG